MPNGLRPYSEKELNSYQDAFEQSNLPLAWRHLERAHILGQPWQWSIRKYTGRC